jgi:serine phosphatase RsbU (regulator of sigma subunit)
MAVAGQASVSLENARLHEDLLKQERLRRDVELAHQVQLSFLPKQDPVVPGYEFFSYYEPAQQVGGDYYGFIPLSGAQPRMAVMLGDVAGKGVPAALMMAKLSADARSCMLSEPDPAKAISTLNDLLCQHTTDMDRFVTLAAALLDYQAHTVTLVNAGHPMPLLVRLDALAPVEAGAKGSSGLPLGVMDGYRYESSQVSLGPGDYLLIFSDGITESMDKQNRQLDYLKAISSALQDGARTPKALGERLVKTVKQHAAGRPQHDDATLVCFGRTAG